MNAALFKFSADDSGAITVDWVLLSAACVGMALAALALIGGGVRHAGLHTSGIVAEYEIDNEFDTQAEIDALVAATDPGASDD
jgi:hypothetical protein